MSSTSTSSTSPMASSLPAFAVWMVRRTTSWSAICWPVPVTWMRSCSASSFQRNSSATPRASGMKRTVHRRHNGGHDLDGQERRGNGKQIEVNNDPGFQPEYAYRFQWTNNDGPLLTQLRTTPKFITSCPWRALIMSEQVCAVVATACLDVCAGICFDFFSIRKCAVCHSWFATGLYAEVA